MTAPAEGSPFVLYDLTDGVATLTLNRPERLNAWVPEMADRYYALMEHAAGDPEVRVIVITGAGRAFCAGADMAQLDTLRSGPLPGEERPQEVFHTSEIPKPVIAAINGACVGIAFLLAATCDVRFAATGAKLSTTFARLGLNAEAGISWILPRLMGVGPALDILLSGRTFLAEEGRELRFVDRVYPHDRLLPETLSYARDMAARCSPTSFAVIKAQVYRDLHREYATAERDALKLTLEALRRPDFQEGLASFSEKRPPRFAPLRQRP
jgi:enoyl-CoA hydratase/carnithine racemase